MTKEERKELIKQLRIDIPRKFAEELLSVQSMDPKPLQDYIEAAKNGPTEQELIDAGYKPVSHLKLAWIKKD